MNTPPPDSSYIHNELIIKFRPESINLNLLCFDYPETDTTDSTKSAIMAQRFYVDDIIADSALLAGIKSFGGDTLKRITSANPCYDTISISRLGDTLLISDYLWMTLHINNDTSVIHGKDLLDSSYINKIEMTDPNYFLETCDRTPIDNLFPEQISLSNQMIHIERAWDFTTGSIGVKVGIIDNGIDYCHIEFAQGIGPYYPIAGGWNYTENNNNIRIGATHGTPVAGIIGAQTNWPINGVAGILGWWEGEFYGCQIYGYRVALNQDNESNNETIKTDYAIAAIREASAYHPTLHSGVGVGYGYGMHVLNNSWAGSYYSEGFWVCEALRSAVNYAYEHGVSFVASRGNYGDDPDPFVHTAPMYPACYENEWVTNVGASSRDKHQAGYSQYLSNMDLLAPGGLYKEKDDEIEPPQWEKFTLTTKYLGGYDYSGKTSAAAAYVSGVLGLLRSYYRENQLGTLEPVDYEGMLKASCEDLVQPAGIYNPNYDEPSGWGFLRADNLFNMIEDGYNMTLIHDENYNNMSYGDWSDWDARIFINDVDSRLIPKPLKSGIYFVKHREITSTIFLPENAWIIDDDHNLYVWGRKEFVERSGLSIAGPVNYQTYYTQVTSGTGGNGYVDGIIHNHSLEVSVRNYQYDVWLWNFWPNTVTYIGHVPADNQLGFNIGIYGKQSGARNRRLSVDESSQILTNNTISVSPNPVKEKANIYFKLLQDSKVILNIYDLFGNNIIKTNPVFLESGSYSNEIDFRAYKNGLYFCKISIDDSFYTVKLLKID